MTKTQFNKLSTYLKLTIVFLILTALIGAGIFYTQFSSFLGTSGSRVVYTNSMYRLYGEPTELQRTLFKELTNEIESEEFDELKIVGLVVKNFVADFYTWTNKAGAFDVGGKDFIFAQEFTNFNAHARRYIYSDMSVYLSSGLAKRSLNEVVDVEVLSADYAYFYDYYGETFQTFYVEASWSYQDSDALDLSAFPTWGAFTLIKTPEGRYEIVRFY